MRPTGPALLYGGLAVVAAGFALIAATWGWVAGLDSVALQVPYLVSGGLTGLGLVIVGATAVNIHAKRREAAERERQTQQLLAILRQVTVALGGTLPEAAEPDGAADDSPTEAPATDPATEELLWQR